MGNRKTALLLLIFLHTGTHTIQAMQQSSRRLRRKAPSKPLPTLPVVHDEHRSFATIIKRACTNRCTQVSQARDYLKSVGMPTRQRYLRGLLIQLKAYTLITFFIAMQFQEQPADWYGRAREFSPTIMIKRLLDNIRIVDMSLYSPEKTPLHYHYNLYAKCAFEAIATTTAWVTTTALSVPEQCMFQAFQAVYTSTNSSLNHLPICLCTISTMLGILHKQLMYLFLIQPHLLNYPELPKNYTKKLIGRNITTRWHHVYQRECTVNKMIVRGHLHGINYEVFNQEFSFLRARGSTYLVEKLSADKKFVISTHVNFSTLVDDLTDYLSEYDYSPRQHAPLQIGHLVQD